MKHVFSKIFLLGLLTLTSCQESSFGDGSMYIPNSEDSETSISAVSEVTSATSGSITENVTHNITLSDAGITSSASNGITISNSTLTILQGGTYALNGTLSNGRIIINAALSKVYLILNGVDISNTSGYPVIQTLAAEKTFITIAKGSSNILKDSLSNTLATIKLKGDATFRGEGALTIYGQGNNGISCSADLNFNGTSDAHISLYVEAKNNAISADNSVDIEYGAFHVVTTDGDGVQVDDETNVSKGYIHIVDGSYTFRVSNDALQAYRHVQIDGGIFDIKTGNGSTASTTTKSQKGIKSSVLISINGGQLDLDTQDDGLHSNHEIVIQGGDIDIKTADDGVHADQKVTVSNGKLTIEKSREGVEAIEINFNGGEVKITSTDDGINAAGGDGSNTDWGGTISEVGEVNIRAGYLYINAGGDGLDSNGTIVISGGTTIVNGPTSDGNGPIDVGDRSGYLSMMGGLLIATGSSGMAVGPTQGSQYSLIARHSSAINSSSRYVITDSNNNPLLSFIPAKTSYSFVVSSPDFLSQDYRLYTGGTIHNPTVTFDGLSLGGTYETGSLLTSWTFSSSNVHVSYGSSNNRPR